MSSDGKQAAPDQFKTAKEIRDDDPDWTPLDDEEPDTGSRTRCECGATVSKQFARVFGNNDDELINGCPACATAREFRPGERTGNGVGTGGNGR